jgi:hypothetical protein
MSHRDDASTSNLPNRCIDEGRHMCIIISEQIHADLAAADYDLRMIQLVLDFLAFWRQSASGRNSPISNLSSMKRMREWVAHGEVHSCSLDLRTNLWSGQAREQVSFLFLFLNNCILGSINDRIVICKIS